MQPVQAAEQRLYLQKLWFFRSLEVILMGEVAVIIRVMPESPEVDFKQLKADIKAAVPASVKLHGMQEKPIAFGLKALIVAVKMDDKTGGGTGATEEAFSKIKGVESVEVEEVGLI
jgi:elongation factor 1-beta